MNQNSQELLAQALDLSTSERGRLAALLIDSLETEVDEDADATWAEEIQRRVEDIDRGRVQLIPWSEVRRRMRDADESGD